MMPLSSYLAVVCRLGASFLSQPYFFTASSRLLRRPWLARRPAVALPLLYSRMSGAWSELRTWEAVERICSKALASNLTLAPVSDSNSLMASFQALPIAESSLSKCHRVRVLPFPSVLSDDDPDVPEHPASIRAPAARTAPIARCLLRICYLLVVEWTRVCRPRSHSDAIC